MLKGGPAFGCGWWVTSGYVTCVAWVVGYRVALSVAFIPDLNICDRVGQRLGVVGGLRQGTLRMWPG